MVEPAGVTPVPRHSAVHLHKLAIHVVILTPILANRPPCHKHGQGLCPLLPCVSINGFNSAWAAAVVPSVRCVPGYERPDLIVKAGLCSDPRYQSSIVECHDVKALGANIPIRGHDIAQALGLEHENRKRKHNRQVRKRCNCALREKIRVFSSELFLNVSVKTPSPGRRGGALSCTTSRETGPPATTHHSVRVIFDSTKAIRLLTGVNFTQTPKRS